MKPADSHYDRGTGGGQVTSSDVTSVKSCAARPLQPEPTISHEVCGVS